LLDPHLGFGRRDHDEAPVFRRDLVRGVQEQVPKVVVFDLVRE
jgi:hypothetical protein